MALNGCTFFCKSCEIKKDASCNEEEIYNNKETLPGLG